MALWDKIIDNDLVDVKTAAKIIGVNRSVVNHLIKQGRFQIIAGSNRRFWLTEKSARKYAKKREAKLLTIFRCQNCGHEWHLKTEKPKRKRRCSKCWSSNIMQYKPSTIEKIGSIINIKK